MLHASINTLRRTASFRIIVLISAVFLSLPAVGVTKQSRVKFFNLTTVPFLTLGLVNLVVSPLYYTFYKEKK